MHARVPLRRTLIAPLIAIALAGLIVVPSAVGHTPVPNPSLWAGAGPERFPPAGNAVSAIRFFEDLHISIYTRLANQPPGVRWIVQLYDKGTCTIPRNYIANLGTITPGQSGVGARTVFLDARARDELLEAIERGRRIVLRLTRPGGRVCLPFSVQRPAPPTTASPSQSSTPSSSIASSSTASSSSAASTSVTSSDTTGTTTASTTSATETLTTSATTTLTAAQ